MQHAGGDSNGGDGIPMDADMDTDTDDDLDADTVESPWRRLSTMANDWAKVFVHWHVPCKYANSHTQTR
jgi:hypothetical protein